MKSLKRQIGAIVIALAMAVTMICSATALTPYGHYSYTHKNLITVGVQAWAYKNPGPYSKAAVRLKEGTYDSGKQWVTNGMIKREKTNNPLYTAYTYWDFAK